MSDLVYEYLPCVQFLAADLVDGRDDAQAAVEQYITETVGESFAMRDVRAAAKEIVERVGSALP